MSEVLRDPATTSSTRLTQLDGLRGLAALVVLLSHLALTTSGLANAWLDRPTDVTPVQYALLYSPLHLLWNGTAAVYVFFVLSGFVLVLPVARAAGRADWGSYYAKRIIRLYLPVWGSLALASVLLVVVPHVSAESQTWWTRDVTIPFDPWEVAHDALLLLPTGLTNTPLWSLRWEVVFSLLLPLYALFALRFRRAWPIKILLLLIAIFAGGVLAQEWLFYLPIFAFGGIIAVEREAITARVRQTPQWLIVVIMVLTVLLLNAVWFVPQPLPGAGAVPTVGAAIAVILFVAWAPAARLGNTSIARWLGRVSFSLYLVHVPVVLATTWLVRPVSPYLSVAIGFVAALLVAEVFYRFVEHPSHLLAMNVGRRVRSAPKAVPEQ
jgi:peptidoglycan/LPS O-acetylase OafA/YrhL